MNIKQIAQSSLAAMMVCLLGVQSISAATEYATDTDWNGADLTLQDGDVIAGVHSNIGHFVVATGATVTVKPVTDGPAYGRVHVLANSASIEGVLSADVAGYPEGEGEGAGSGRCGAGYGGRGGIGDVTGRGGDIYGSPVAPDRLGSGGGTGGTGVGGTGGGAVRIEATGTITVGGTISANGGDGGYRSGGGSGGSIWLAAQTIAGNGSVVVDGGEGDIAAGGGGGRMAFSTPDNQFSGLIRARGPSGRRYRARSGTFNFQSKPTVDLVIDADIALPPGTNWVFRSLTVPAGVIVVVPCCWMLVVS